ncbi:PQQ-binding-like beta-propeller repeat protein [Streptomyces sp. B5E4]|uniref:outer membrane protein assembly factor BamB family protein n=1 Tax=Streptomyces sp. B5E4 TaxID=3153568 RepID=UPI00325F45C6
MADEYGQNGQAGGFGPPPPNGPGVPPGTPAPPPGPPSAPPPPVPPQQPAGGPYGQPQQHRPMAAAGMPAQPGPVHATPYAYPAPPPPGSGGGKKAVAIVLSVLVVLAVLGGGAAVVLLADDDGGGSSAQDELPANALEQLWSTPLEGTHVAGGDSSSLPGLWPAGGHVVHGDEDGGMRAYDARSGKEKWKVKPPERAGELCAMSRGISPGGIGAVAFDAGGDDCAYLAAIEVDTGTVLWSQNLAGDYSTSNPVLSVNDSTISTTIGSYVNNRNAKGGGPGLDFTSRGRDCDTPPSSSATSTPSAAASAPTSPRATSSPSSTPATGTTRGGSPASTSTSSAPWARTR